MAIPDLLPVIPDLLPVTPDLLRYQLLRLSIRHEQCYSPVHNIWIPRRARHDGLWREVSHLICVVSSFRTGGLAMIFRSAVINLQACKLSRAATAQTNKCIGSLHRLFDMIMIRSSIRNPCHHGKCP